MAAENAAQFLAFDLSTGRVNESHFLYPYLLEHGVAEHNLDWFQRNAVKYGASIGANFYPSSSAPWSNAGRRSVSSAM